MKKLAILIGILSVLGALLQGLQVPEHADMILINGKIFTGLDEKPRFQAVAVKDGKIIAVGKNEEIAEYIGPSTQVLDVEGKLVIPGFIDAHCHFSSGGQSLTKLDLRDARTIENIQDRIAERIKELSEGELLVAYASFPNPSLYRGLGWPTKEILDKVSPNNPIIIQRRGGHAVWVNSVALEKSGVTKYTESPPGGEIVKDSVNGEPTGILKEAASNLLKVWDKPKPKEDIERALEHAAQLGITGLQTGSYIKEIEIFKELKKEGKLTLRVYAWISVHELDRALERGLMWGQGDEMVRVGLVKMFIDGTIGVRSALMFESFTEEPGNTGLAQYEEEEFYALVEKAHKSGYQVGVHAIGDKAVHWVLNAFERAQKKHGKKGLRHRVEHCTVVTFEDTERFGELGVVASMQPNITGSEIYRRVRLGKERTRRVDMWRTLLNNGAVLAWGTDWPVSPINPMENLYQLVTRYYKEERLTIAEAVKHYTYGSAYASHEEDVKGTLEKGKLADMVVLSRDLFTIPSREILRTEVLYTILGGKVVYQK
jgi:predicted amidohydrolase YtcJ